MMQRALGVLIAVLLCGAAGADVFNMGGTRNADGSWTGLASLETVPVGNPGNAGELSGSPDWPYSTERICGAVDYVYNIGKYEVTTGQYCEFLNAVAGVDTYGLFNTSMWSSEEGCKIERFAGSGTVGDLYQYRVAADWANRPVNFVSWGDATRFSNWLHNGQPTGLQDLTTTEDGAYFVNGAISNDDLKGIRRQVDWKWAIAREDEWYKAAYHKNDGATGNYWDYPTSSDIAPGRDITEATNPGNNANYHDGGYLIGPPYYRTQVGEFELSESPYGTFDQGGNVNEWTDTLLYWGVPAAYYCVIRGGEYFAPPPWGDPLHAVYRGHTSPVVESSHIGFRVVEVPEPASLSLLALGAVAVLRRRR